MLFTLLSMLSVSPAHAVSEIEFKTQRPVVIYVDDKQAALTGKLHQRMRNLQAGTHDVRVEGVFGKTLFEAELDLPDGTVTEVEWKKGELSVLGTRWMEEDEVQGPAAEPAPEPEPEETKAAEKVSLAVPAPPAQKPAAPQPPASPEAPPAPVVKSPTPPVSAPLAVPPPAVQQPAKVARTLPAAAAGRTLKIQAQEGMRIEVTHDNQLLVLRVQNGVFLLEDPNGVEIAFSE